MAGKEAYFGGKKFGNGRSGAKGGPEEGLEGLQEMKGEFVMGEAVEEFRQELEVGEEDIFCGGKGVVADGGIEGGDECAQSGQMIISRGVRDEDAQVCVSYGGEGGVKRGDSESGKGVGGGGSIGRESGGGFWRD